MKHSLSRSSLSDLIDTCRRQDAIADRTEMVTTVLAPSSSMSPRCSTEDALDALLDGIEGYERLILVGDPRQLPPIGVGRPFVDIVQYLRDACGPLGFPRVGPSYAETYDPQAASKPRRRSR